MMTSWLLGHPWTLGWCAFVFYAIGLSMVLK